MDERSELLIAIHCKQILGLGGCYGNVESKGCVIVACSSQRETDPANWSP